MYAVCQAIGQPVPLQYKYKAIVHQTMVLFVEGRGKKEVLEEFMTYLVDENDKNKDSIFFQLYRYDICRSYWRKSGQKIGRDIRTVILPESTWNTVC